MAMNEKELRIGNFVLCSYRYELCVEVIKSIYYDDIEGIYKVEFESGHFSGTNGVSLRGISPIPLNRDALELAGFKYSGNHVYEYKDDENILFDEPNDWNNAKDYPIQIVGGSGGYILVYIPHGETIIRCLYLHQLQNFFYCITGKELEIKKEWL